MSVDTDKWLQVLTDSKSSAQERSQALHVLRDVPDDEHWFPTSTVLGATAGGVAGMSAPFIKPLRRAVERKWAPEVAAYRDAHSGFAPYPSFEGALESHRDLSKYLKENPDIYENLADAATKGYDAYSNKDKGLYTRGKEALSAWWEGRKPIEKIAKSSGGVDPVSLKNLGVAGGMMLGGKALGALVGGGIGYALRPEKGKKLQEGNLTTEQFKSLLDVATDPDASVEDKAIADEAIRAQGKRMSPGLSTEAQSLMLGSLGMLAGGQLGSRVTSHIVNKRPGGMHGELASMIGGVYGPAIVGENAKKSLRHRKVFDVATEDIGEGLGDIKGATVGGVLPYLWAGKTPDSYTDSVAQLNDSDLANEAKARLEAGYDKNTGGLPWGALIASTLGGLAGGGAGGYLAHNRFLKDFDKQIGATKHAFMRPKQGDAIIDQNVVDELDELLGLNEINKLGLRGEESDNLIKANLDKNKEKLADLQYKVQENTLKAANKVMPLANAYMGRVGLGTGIGASLGGAGGVALTADYSDPFADDKRKPF